jgi:hypothetical protein
MDELLKLLDITITQDEYVACKYLESRGLKFCYDFGIANAQDIMIDLLIQDEIFALKESTVN